MPQASHINDIAFSSGFAIDKIFPTKFTGSFPVAAAVRTTGVVPNPYGTSVFPIMQFSNDSSTWYDAGSVIYNASGGSVFQATCYTDSTNITIVAENYSGGTLTCYYRVLLVSET